MSTTAPSPFPRSATTSSFEPPRGWPDRLVIRTTGVPVVDEAGATYIRLFEVHEAARGDYAVLLDSRRDAKDSDRRALADALVADRKDPGEKASSALYAQLGNAKRMVDASFLAANEAASAYRRVLTEHRAEIEAMFVMQLAAARIAGEEPLDDLLARLAAVEAACANAAWVHNGPRTGGTQAARARIAAAAELVGAVRAWLAEPTELDPKSDTGLEPRSTFGQSRKPAPRFGLDDSDPDDDAA